MINDELLNEILRGIHHLSFIIKIRKFGRVVMQTTANR
jgi:hypothetical protein